MVDYQYTGFSGRMTITSKDKRRTCVCTFAYADELLEIDGVDAVQARFLVEKAKAQAFDYQASTLKLRGIKVEAAHQLIHSLGRIVRLPRAESEPCASGGEHVETSDDDTNSRQNKPASAGRR